MGRRGRQDLEGEEFFFITTTVVKFARVFTQDNYCDILLHNVKHYQKWFLTTMECVTGRPPGVTVWTVTALDMDGIFRCLIIA